MNREEEFDSFSGKRIKKEHNLEEIFKNSDEIDISTVSIDTTVDLSFLN